MPTSLRTCARCGHKLSLKRQRHKHCYRCDLVVKRERDDKAHDAYVAKTYGIKLGDYARLYAAQGGKCYICQRATGKARRLAVDHDHVTGLVRGLLCKPCNRMLGHARDDSMMFRRAAGYLERPPARGVVYDSWVEAYPLMPCIICGKRTCPLGVPTCEGCDAS